MNPSPQDVLHHFISSRREWDQERHRGVEGYLRASEFGPCEREQHFKRLGIERTRDFDEKTLLTFEWGNLLEAVVREAYRACGLLVASQVSLKDDELKTTATTDLVIGGGVQKASEVDASELQRLFYLLEQEADDLVDVERFLEITRANLLMRYGPVMPYKVLEVKSQKDSAMMWAYKQGPSDGYKLQVGVQQLLAERNPDQMPVPVQSFGIVYVGKGNWGILDWDAELSWKDAALKRIDRLNFYIETAHFEPTLPPCTCASVWDDGRYQYYCAYTPNEALAPYLERLKHAGPFAKMPALPYGLCCDEKLIEKVPVVAGGVAS